MNKILLAAAVLTAAVSATAGGDSVNFDQGVHVTPVLEEALLGSREPSQEAAVWIAVSPADAIAAKAAGLPLDKPSVATDSSHVFKVQPDFLPVLSDFLHKNSGRCGGFFAFRSKEEAEAPVRPAGKGGPYTVDQGALVAPLMPLVQEAEIRSTIEGLASFHNRYYTAESGVKASNWLRDRWQALAAGVPGAEARLVAHSGWKQPSVVLTIPGTEKPEEIVVLGGHLDSINGQRGQSGRAPGADDNASGIAVITEAVRVLGQSGLRPKRTIQFMGYAAEEVGLRGSQDIARQAAREGKKVVAVIQYDMTNYKGSGDKIFLLSDNVDPALTAFLGKLTEAYAGVPWSTTACGYGCSDHASWTRSGFSASAAFESSFNDMNHSIHSERDTLATAGGTAQHSVPFAKLAVAFAVEAAKAAPAPGVSAAPLELVYKDRDKTYDLSAGQQVRISLRYNPKAGNVWKVLQNGAPALRLVGIENGGANQVVVFEAAAAGSGAISLKYEGPSAPKDYAFNAVFNVRAR